MTTTTEKDHETMVDNDDDEGHAELETMKTAAAAAAASPKERHCFETPIKWFNVFAMSSLHLAALYGMYLMLTKAKIATVLFWWSYGSFASQGITAGAHRLWAHRSYKARLPLRIVLAVANLVSLQNDIYTWCRDHRVHHKFSDTDADPHNSQRGFFFAHVGWLLCKKHPEVASKGATVDCQDVLADPVVYWQRKFYLPLVIFFCFYLPTMVPVWYWQESLEVAFYVSLLRYVYQLNGTWLVNSAAHKFGMKTYDASMQPRENAFVVYATYGEGFHSYHHTFPYDYSASELGFTLNWNITTMFIDFCALIGQAYDLRKPSETVIKSRVQRTGIPAEHGKEVAQRRQHQVFNMLIATVIGFSHLWVPLSIRLLTMRLQS